MLAFRDVVALPLLVVVAAAVVAVVGDVLEVSAARACAGPSQKKASALVLQDFQAASARCRGYQTASPSVGELALQLEDILEALRISSVVVAAEVAQEQQLAGYSSADLESFQASGRSESDSRSADPVADAAGDVEFAGDAAAACGCSASSASVQ